MTKLLVLRSWVFDVHPSGTFRANIANTKTVCDLKEAIEDKNPNTFRHVDACELLLRKVPLLANNHASFEENLCTFEPMEEQALCPMDTLSEVFPDLPTRLGDYLHIIVRLPLSE